MSGVAGTADGQAELRVIITRIEVKVDASSAKLEKVDKKIDDLLNKFRFGEQNSPRSKFPIRNIKVWDEVVQLIEREDEDAPIMTTMVRIINRMSITVTKSTINYGRSCSRPKISVPMQRHGMTRRQN